MSTQIFSYAFAREPGERGQTFLKFLRRSYFVKALMMLPIVPLDLLLFATSTIFSRRPSRPRPVFLTAKFPSLVDHDFGNGAVFIGPPTWTFVALRRRGVYVPASIAYCLLGLVSWRSECARNWASASAIALMRLCMRCTGCSGGVLLHHSDALPFARCVLVAGSSLDMKTVCIQHGIFHPNSEITEVEGHLSDLNIARSGEDAAMIRAAGLTTRIFVEPDFFLPMIDRKTQVATAALRVLLIGEGWHSIDTAFDKAYNDELRRLEVELEKAGCHAVFRPHPSERVHAHRMGFRRVDKLPLEASLNEADVVVGYASTVLFEASSVGIAACQIAVQGGFAEGLARGGVHVQPVASVAEIIDFAQLNQHAIQRSASVRARRMAATQRVVDAMKSVHHPCSA